MSVKLKDYCSNSKGEISDKLQKLLDWSVLIGGDEIELNVGKIWTKARISVYHPLSCHDLEILQDVLKGSYWWITSSFKPVGYGLIINFDNL